jgi:hypothetical protein
MPGGFLIEGLERGFGNRPGDAEKSATAGALRSVGSAVRGVGAFDDSATRSVTRMVAGEQGVTEYNRRRAQGAFAPMPGDLFTAISNPLFDAATSLKRGVRDTPLTRTSEAAGNLAPGLLVSVANPWVGAGYFAAQGADSQNQAAIRAGKAGTWQTDLGVLGNAGVQGGLGLIPGARFERFVPRFASPAVNLAVKVGTRTTAGALGGAASNVSGNLIEKSTVNPDKKILDGTGESILTGGLLSAGHVGVETARGSGAKAGTLGAESEVHSAGLPKGSGAETAPPAITAREPHPAMKAVKAVADHHNLTAAVRSARDSVLRQEAPDQFRAFTARVAEAAQIPDLHVAPDALDTVLATPEGQRVQMAIPDLPDRVVAARDAGADVPVTADEYLTHVGPELHDQIAGDVRVGADAMSPAEVVADHQSRVTALQSASADAEANANDPEAFRRSRQDVTDAVRQQYDRETVGKLAPQQRAVTAELTGHAFAVEAAKQGVEPMELYRQTQVFQASPAVGNDTTFNLSNERQLPELVPPVQQDSKSEAAASGSKNLTEEIESSPGHKGSGETTATITGKTTHSKLANGRRISGEFDLVNSSFLYENGTPVQVPKRVDLSTGRATDNRVQNVRPDAVNFESDLILDDKPYGRPIAKDRQEIIRFIGAYEIGRGKPPRIIAIQRYDPKTGVPILTELYDPQEFLPRKQ